MFVGLAQTPGYSNFFSPFRLPPMYNYMPAVILAECMEDSFRGSIFFCTVIQNVPVKDIESP